MVAVDVGMLIRVSGQSESPFPSGKYFRIADEPGVMRARVRLLTRSELESAPRK